MKQKTLPYLNWRPLKIAIIALPLIVSVMISPLAYAATSPSLGTAGTYGVLANTYTNTVSGTTITGNLGYTTGPSVAPVVTGGTDTANSAYTQAGTDQATALAALNSQSCTFSFATGAIDLATDTTHGTVGVYTPGVYCITGSAAIGAAGISLSGSGVYIFRISGALTTTAASAVTLSGGASPTDLWWTPLATTTLGANSTFSGTDIDNAGITIGNLVTWSGNALAYNGTISTSRDTITGSTFSSGSSGSGSGSGGSSNGNGTSGSSSTTTTSTAGTSAASSASATVPNTGFGTFTTYPLYSLAAYFFGGLALLLLARIIRKTTE